MKLKVFIFLFVLSITSVAMAKDTKVLFDSYKMTDQISSNYYISESLKPVNNKIPNILQVNTYRIVTSSDGSTEYKSLFNVDCNKEKYQLLRSWSSGLGEDTTLDAEKWENVTEWPDTKALYEAICSKK